MPRGFDRRRRGAGRNAEFINSASPEIETIVRGSVATEIAIASVSLEHGECLRAMCAEDTTESFPLDDWRVSASRRPSRSTRASTSMRGDTQTTDKRFEIFY